MESIKDEDLSYEFKAENIKIYGNLKKGQTITLVYDGKLVNTNEKKLDSSITTEYLIENYDNICKDKSNPDIFLHYGFGGLWEDKNHLKLNYYTDNESSSFYYTDINLSSTNGLYFCFMDDKNNWDLNTNNVSYFLEITEESLDISKTCNELQTLEDTNKLSLFICNLRERLILFLNNLGNLFNTNYNKL